VKIGMVTQSYYPHVGGVTEHVHHLSGALGALGHDVRIVTAGPASGGEQGVVRIGRNFRFPINGALVNVTVGFRLVRDLSRIFRREAFDVIHIHSPMEPTLPLAALSAARDLESPVVGTFHMSARISPAYEVFAAPLDKYARRLDARIAVSEAAKRFASRYFPGEYTVIPNGVCFNRFAGAGKPRGRPAEKPTVLFVGRFDPRKNVPLLISSFKHLLKSKPHCRLVLVGSGPVRPVCSIMALPLKGSVRFAGRVDPAEIPSYYAACDVFCSVPTGSESFGIVLLEAMAAGKPVIGTDIPGYRDVVRNRVEGLLVPPGDTDALTDALRALIDDGERRRAMGLMGQERARAFDWSGIACSVEGVYRNVLRRPAKEAGDGSVRSEGVCCR
jgi:phosphatidylinositol alpha-mannosyltransferase